MTSAFLAEKWQNLEKISKICNFLNKNHILMIDTILDSIPFTGKLFTAKNKNYLSDEVIIKLSHLSLSLIMFL